MQCMNAKCLYAKETRVARLNLLCEVQAICINPKVSQPLVAIEGIEALGDKSSSAAIALFLSTSELGVSRRDREFVTVVGCAAFTGEGATRFGGGADV
eukprot:CAMPEP_0119366364 /NCGR_PEP_ID=MMETSP1334-20130426/13219_1 /TAXON_ID=127549 /ORGANISM="Calcidiscus leptoporus, Strain RCC1130" /LENGTH=97 /DNA_ID=CAMNT_0007382551 /DNA_START=208 /DNA_END=502 /DNA_ORIENTATION=-